MSAYVAGREHAMMLITTFIQRVWQRAQKANEPDAAGRFNDGRDRSSMADFVRILQAHDHPQAERNPAWAINKPPKWLPLAPVALPRGGRTAGSKAVANHCN